MRLKMVLKTEGLNEADPQIPSHIQHRWMTSFFYWEMVLCPCTLPTCYSNNCPSTLKTILLLWPPQAQNSSKAPSSCTITNCLSTESLISAYKHTVISPIYKTKTLTWTHFLHLLSPSYFSPLKENSLQELSILTVSNFPLPFSHDQAFTTTTPSKWSVVISMTLNNIHNDQLSDILYDPICSISEYSTFPP